MTCVTVVACNLAGTNAFVVAVGLAHKIAEYPPKSLYQSAKLQLMALRCLRGASLSFYEEVCGRCL